MRAVLYEIDVDTHLDLILCGIMFIGVRDIRASRIYGKSFRDVSRAYNLTAHEHSKLTNTRDGRPIMPCCQCPYMVIYVRLPAAPLEFN